MDIYSIGLKVDSRQVRTGQRDLNRFGQQSKKTGDSVNRFGKEVDRSSKSVSGMSSGADLARRALAGLIAALSVRRLQQFAASTIAAADAIDNAARTAGVGAERLQELRFAFGQLVGTTEGEVDAALRRFNRRLGLAADGSGAAKDTFEELDIALRDANGAVRNTDIVLDEAIDKLGSIQSDSRRAALASRMFGEDAGPALAAALSEGTQAMEDASAQAVVMGDDIAAQGSRIQDDIDAMSTNIRVGLQNAFLGAAIENEEQIRRLVATTLRGMATVAEFGDRVAGPLGAGLIGRVLFGKKGAVIGILLTSAIQTVNSIINRLNETTGQAILRLEERAEQLQDTIEGMPEIHPVRRAAEADLERVQSKLDELNEERMDSIEIENQYQKALKETGSVGEDIGEVLRQAADRFEQPQEVTTTRRNIFIPTSSAEDVDGVNDSLFETVRNIDRITSSTQRARGVWGDVGQAIIDVEDTIESGIGNALEDLIFQAESASEIFRQLARDIATAILRQQVIDPFAQAATSVITGAIGGGVGGGGAGFSGVGNATPRQFANGGNVFGGTPAIVGERGPELFVPGQDGQIVPNHRMGGGDVTVNIINQGGDQLEAEQRQTRRGPNGEMMVDVMVKSSMERLDSQGQLDGIFRRHGAQRQGQF